MILLVGDSITAGLDVGKYFPGTDVVNKGVSGDNTDLVLARLAGDVIGEHPDHLFILIGTNDMASLFPNEKILANYELILRRLNERLPGTHIAIQSILPTRGLENRPVERIRLLNSRIETVAKKYGAGYLDLTQLFAGPDGTLPAALSVDGLHLTEAGYDLWAAYLRKVFDECV